MNEASFSRFLIDQRIAIVHFSHFAVMNHAVEFPVDLHHAIDNYQAETRSCCAIWPRHQMPLPGSVGVIFEPSLAHVLSVLPIDAGSSDVSGSEYSGGSPPSEEAILESFNVPFFRYNEWRVRGAKPIGIFVDNPHNIQVKKKELFSVCGETTEQIVCKEIPFSAVVDAFPTLPIYTIGPDGLIDLRVS